MPIFSLTSAAMQVALGCRFSRVSMNMMPNTPANPDLWDTCLERLAAEIPAEALHSWIKPLQACVQGRVLYLFAPNTFVMEEVRENYLERIRELAAHFGALENVELKIGSLAAQVQLQPASRHATASTTQTQSEIEAPFESHLDSYFNFDNFVEGRQNAMARAAAMMAAQRPGAREHNPLLLYGSTGLGKTHLMLAAGNEVKRTNPNARVLYLRSEEFYRNFVSALKENRTDQFKKFFSKINLLLIDDIQFFAGKDRTQEEFFHTFNMLVEKHQQLILTSDRFPREVEGLEPRLTSRLNNGLSVSIDPPDFETRALIVLTKARERGVEVPEDVAAMIAKNIPSNVRSLEGALNTLLAKANLSKQAITTDFASDTLRDLFRAQQAVINLPNIQKVVADYYDLQLRVMLSKSRKQTITRARQMAMALARELTDRSLPEIGQAFERDHTTVMNACKKISELRESDASYHEDWRKLTRKLTE